MTKKKMTKQEFLYELQNGEIVGMRPPTDMYGYPIEDRPRQRVNTTPVDPRFALLTGSEGIVSEERRGRDQLAASEQITADLVKDAKSRDLLEALGFTNLKLRIGDDLFADIDFPKGWTKKHDPEDHRTTNVFDDKGRKRLYMWYKSASYDRAAYGGFCRRFEVIAREFNDYTETRVYIIDKLGSEKDRVIYTKTGASPKGAKAYDARENFEKEMRVAACEWAKEQGIDINNPLANWDDAPLPTVGKFPPWGVR